MLVARRVRVTCRHHSRVTRALLLSASSSFIQHPLAVYSLRRKADNLGGTKSFTLRLFLSSQNNTLFTARAMTLPTAFRQKLARSFCAEKD
jgi:hypothetical protein